MKKIVVLIQALNEEKQVQECVQSAKLLTATIILADQGNSDNTVTLAKKGGAKIITVPSAKYVEEMREIAIAKVDAEWICILDADERMTKALADEIKRAILSNEYTSYKIPRKNIFGRKKWLKYGGWWPDFQIRLVSKTSLKSWPKQIHSTPIIEGRQGYLTNPLLHFFHGDLETMVQKTIVFEQIEAELLFKALKPASTTTFHRKFLGEFSRRFFLSLGFMDGTIGILEAIYQAFSKTITYLFLYEKKISRSL